MAFADKAQKGDESREPAGVLLKKIDRVSLYEVREYLAQREEREFFSRIEEMKAADHSVIFDPRTMAEYDSRKITLFIDPKYMESIPEEKRQEEMQKLWETGSRILAGRGIAVYARQAEIHDDSEDARPASKDGKKWELQFDVDCDRSVPEEVKSAAQKKRSDAWQWSRKPGELTPKVKEALAEINDPEVTKQIEINDPNYHPIVIANMLANKTIKDAVQARIADTEQFLKDQIAKAKTEAVAPPPL